MNHHRPFDGLTLSRMFDWLYVALAGYATCFTVFTRRRFGREALGVNGVAALIILIVYSSCYPYSRGMGLFFVLWFVALILQRLCTVILARRRSVHSHCTGYPWLGYMVPFVRKYMTAVFIECLVLFVLGVFLMPVDFALGQFVFYGAGSVFLKTGIDEDIERRRLFRMRDAEIEQRSLADRYRTGDF